MKTSLRLKVKGILVASVSLFLCLIPGNITADYTTYEAINHIGSVDRVCGFCVGGMVEKREKGSPTYLYFEYMYGKAIFKVKIWDFDRKKFSQPPEVMYKDKAVCVSGTIDVEMGKPFINVIEPGQMEFMKPYVVQSEEEAGLEESARFHNLLFKPKDRVALKILLKALGYKIPVLDDNWDMDAFKAAKAFEKDNKLPVDGKIKRTNFFKMEDAIAADKKIPYEKQREYFNMVEKLLKRQM